MGPFVGADRAFHVDEHGGVVGCHHDVAGLEVAQDVSGRVHPADHVGEFAGQPPQGRDREQALVVPCDAVGGPSLQALAVDQVFHKEDVAGGFEDVADGRCDAKGCEPLQDAGLVAQPVPGVLAVRGGSDMWPGLLEQDIVTAPPVARAVDATTVGVPDGLTDQIAAGDEDGAAAAAPRGGAGGWFEGGTGPRGR